MSVQSHDASEWSVHPTGSNTPDTLTVSGPAGGVSLSEGDEIIHREAIDSESLRPSKRLIEFRRYDVVSIARTSNIVAYTPTGKRTLSEPTWILRLRRDGHAVAYVAKMVAHGLSDSDPDSNWRRDPPAQMPSTYESWRVWESKLEE